MKKYVLLFAFRLISPTHADELEPLPPPLAKKIVVQKVTARGKVIYLQTTEFRTKNCDEVRFLDESLKGRQLEYESVDGKKINVQTFEDGSVAVCIRPWSIMVLRVRFDKGVKKTGQSHYIIENLNEKPPPPPPVVVKPPEKPPEKPLPPLKIVKKEEPNKRPKFTLFAGPAYHSHQNTPVSGLAQSWSGMQGRLRGEGFFGLRFFGESILHAEINADLPGGGLSTQLRGSVALQKQIFKPVFWTVYAGVGVNSVMTATDAPYGPNGVPIPLIQFNAISKKLMNFTLSYSPPSTFFELFWSNPVVLFKRDAVVGLGIEYISHQQTAPQPELAYKSYGIFGMIGLNFGEMK